MDSMYQMLDRRGTRNAKPNPRKKDTYKNVIIIPNTPEFSFKTDVQSVKQRRRFLKSNEGFVYVVSNKSWMKYLKIGRAVDPYKRVASFNTYDPTQQFRLRYIKYFINCVDAEKAIHELLVKKRVRGEWFRIQLNDAYSSLVALTDSVNT